MGMPAPTRSGPVADVVLLPLGEVSEQIVDRIMAVLRSALGKNVKKMAAGPLGEGALNRQRGQYNSTRILEVLEAERPAVAGARILAIVDVDLYADGLNFVFGEAAPSVAVGVISLWRLNPERFGESADQRLFETRAAREAMHETGHLFGLGHCPDRQCVMSFSNSLSEVDAKSSEFCPACRRLFERF